PRRRVDRARTPGRRWPGSFLRLARRSRHSFVVPHRRIEPRAFLLPRLVGTSGARATGDGRLRRALPLPQDDDDENRANAKHNEGSQPAEEVEAGGRRSHEDSLTIRADERVEDFLRAVAPAGERHHVAMHRRRYLAGKIGRTAGVDIERASALTT